MKYRYYVGFSSGTAKSGRTWWAVNVFGHDRYGKIAVVPVFLNSEEEYQRLQKEAPPIFSPVQLSVDPADGSVTVFKAIDGVAKLNAQ